jgi:hypothetical protein
VDCSPHALPTNFQFRSPSLTGGSCNSTDDEGVSNCLTMSGVSCPAYTSDPTCQACAFSSYTNATWGAFVLVTASGAGAVQIPFFNPGGCLQKVDPFTASACVQALQNSFQCEIEACLAYCPVASGSDTAGMDALLGTSTTNGCLQNADSSVCASYANAVNTACTGALYGDAATDPGTECNNLAGASDLGPYVAAFCGGEDAGIVP